MPFPAVFLSLALTQALHFLLMLAPLFLRHELPTDAPPKPKRLLRLAVPTALGGPNRFDRIRMGCHHAGSGPDKDSGEG
jgi:hypothetical protein